MMLSRQCHWSAEAVQPERRDSAPDPDLPEGKITTVEMHTGGEPVRIVTAGYPPVLGDTILDKRRYARERLDHLRRMLIFEPRGHHDMYGVIPVEPDHPEADIAVLFMHNEGYSTMCGHAVIALGRYAVDTGIVTPTVPLTAVNIQCPCGLVRAMVEVVLTPTGFRTGSVSFESVPSFAFALDAEAHVPGIGTLRFDIGYGGAFYAIVSAGSVGLDLSTSPFRDVVEAADRITKTVQATVALDHPDDQDLAFLYGTIVTDGGTGKDEPSTNVCVFAEREVDRSPTGSGVSARMAVQLARGDISIGEQCQFRSITGSVFGGRILRSERTGRFDAARVEVAGRAFYSGTSSFTIEEDDSIGRGFVLRP